uniref:Uncharacterized protein n=1 Tax=Arundo donax TaxID=35708 RepID=A0A0A8ZPQ7_ARUDO
MHTKLVLHTWKSNRKLPRKRKFKPKNTHASNAA